MLEYLSMLKFNNTGLDISSIEDEYFTFLVATCVRGFDGKENHTMVVFTSCIFDGNSTHAFPLCRRSLNFYCSNDNKPAEFTGFLSHSILHIFYYVID